MSGEWKALSPEAAEWFTASEDLYRAILRDTDAGCPLPAGTESASHVAFSVAMEAIKQRVPCPDWAADQVASDWARFEGFHCRSVGEAFGIPETAHAYAKRTQRRAALVYFRVKELRAEGLVLKDNAKGKGALSLVGDELHMSVKQVEKLMTCWRKLCRDSGCDPDEEPKLADASTVVAQAWVRAWPLDE